MPMDDIALKAHAEKCILSYVKHRDAYYSFSMMVKVILEAALENYSIHTIQARAKEVDSFAKKAIKLDLNTSDLKYPNPLAEITDLAGVRVITYVKKTVENVEEVIRREFSVRERLDKDAELLDSGQIGYKSIHFLVKFKEPRTNSPEYSRFKDLTAEIQVRTILQHAWAEMEHDIQYKSDQQIPNELRRRFIALAGLLEITDREFENIQEEDERLRATLTYELAEDVVKLVAEDVDNQVPAQNDSSDAAIVVLPTVTDAAASFGAALKRYDALIAKQSGQYAHYLGRAKAKFLLGDRSGALEDVSKASDLAPGDEQVIRVKQQIEDGAIKGAESYNSAMVDFLSSGNYSLSMGEFEDALISYTKADQLGAKRSVNALNYAMCACLKMDILEIERHIKDISSFSLYHEINKTAINLISCELSDEGKAKREELASNLRGLVSKARKYDVYNSPLRHLKSGFEELGEAVKYSSVRYVFEILANESLFGKVD